jgi:type IV pilus assembly protein PilM
MPRKKQSGIFGRMSGWLDAMPHPAVVCEIAADHVAIARWSGSGGLEAGAGEPLEDGVIKPSTVEPNVINAAALQAALKNIFDRVDLRGQAIALVLPDPVVRVFIFQFETLPRRVEDSAPLLRWRLKKSIPFDVEETMISSMRQTGHDGGLEIITAVARQSIVREYEQAVVAAGGTPGVVLSSTLACLPLLADSGATMLVRGGRNSLTTAIVHDTNLCVYRSTSLSTDVTQMDAQAILDEIFPAVAYYQDTWGGELNRVLLTGFGEREETLRAALSAELKVNADNLADGASGRELPSDARGMLSQGQEALVGWMANGA